MAQSVPHTTRAALSRLRSAGQTLAKSTRRDGKTAYRVHSSSHATDGDLVGSAIDRVEIAPELIRVTLTQHEDEQPRTIDIPWRQASSRRHREVIASTDRDGPARPMRVETRATLLAAIARGRSWLAEITSGQITDPDAIACREGCSRRQVNATISLAHIAPDIVEAAITGRLPHGVALRDLTDPPLAWSEQRRRIGSHGRRHSADLATRQHLRGLSGLLTNAVVTCVPSPPCRRTVAPDA